MNFLGMKLKNPTLLASGIMGVTADSLQRMISKGAGAVTTKSISINPRTGHPGPCILTYDGGMINAVGLSNPGIHEGLRELKFISKDTPVIISIFANTVQDFVTLAKQAANINPWMIEINLSCPNVEDEFGEPFACDVEKAKEITRLIKDVCDVPIAIKLSPNTSKMVQVALAVEEAGADAITAINTVGPGMIINIEMKKPVLSNKVGGLSGPAIKPIAVRCVYDLYKAVKIPIIGMGGITNWRDAIELMMAGASVVGIGSAVYYEGEEVFEKVAKGMEEFLKKEGYNHVSEIIGIAHKGDVK